MEATAHLAQVRIGERRWRSWLRARRPTFDDDVVAPELLVDIVAGILIGVRQRPSRGGVYTTLYPEAEAAKAAAAAALRCFADQPLPPRPTWQH